VTCWREQSAAAKPRFIKALIRSREIAKVIFVFGYSPVTDGSMTRSVLARLFFVLALLTSGMATPALAQLFETRATQAYMIDADTGTVLFPRMKLTWFRRLRWPS
jgi:D-alanyl-D-alanine carboxypeptidase